MYRAFRKNMETTIAFRKESGKELVLSTGRLDEQANALTADVAFYKDIGVNIVKLSPGKILILENNQIWGILMTFCTICNIPSDMHGMEASVSKTNKS